MAQPGVKASGDQQLKIDGSTLEIVVLFTDVPSTLAALRTAAQLASGLTARIRLLALECVPFPLPLDEPPVSTRFLRRTLRTLIGGCTGEAAAGALDTIVDIQLCRDAWETLRGRLAARSVVVIGKRRRWWPRKEDQLARALRKAGHHVVRTSACRTLIPVGRS